ncbi:DNA internalization-related competence protein ComEC/Rec2 [Ornithinibacillus sp. 4-3]|uniref:DNA internalization-related competence protein ComEC/Rec2 n=1 Tax=Ornithinibacillus sp. 4-3 TaxID=3231488 RepID=A0AB39HHQ0_9BACI
MVGNWHFIAISAVISLLALVYESILFYFVFLIWIFILYFQGKLERILLLMILISLAFFNFYFQEDNAKASDDHRQYQDVTLHGKITSSVHITATSLTFTLQEENTKEKYSIVHFPNEDAVYEEEVLLTLKTGATCKIEGEINHPTPPTNPGEFDFQTYYRNQGITSQVIVSNLEMLQCEGLNSLQFIYLLRMNLIERMNERLSEYTAPWVNALVLGDDSLLEEDTIQLFQRWGLSHILAISGLHVGLMIGMLYFLFLRLNIITKEKLQWVLIFILPIYALLAGGEPSVWRASLMVFLLLILQKLKLKINPLDTLSIIFLVLILFNKYFIYHVGFQFSFLVTFGLILSKTWFTSSHSSMYNLLQISFVSQMMILPLQLHYFHHFQPLSIFLNVIVVPYFSLFVIPFMLFLLIFSPFPMPLIRLLDQLFIFIHGKIMLILEIIDHFFHYPFVIGEISIGYTIIYYIIFVIFMIHLYQTKKIRTFIIGFMLAMFIIYGAAKPYFSPIGYVTMLDIGQGDAFIIELPYRKGVFLIDAGASFSFSDMQPSSKVFKSVIKPYLLSRGIQEIDTIFLSHSDLDHIGSVPYLISEIKVKEIIISEYYPISIEEMRDWTSHNINIRRVAWNEKIERNGLQFHVLSPAKDKHDDNENSLVLQTTIGGESWLFLGDIGKETEEEILKNHTNIKGDVLKVAHHGSNTSSSERFIDQLKPMYALISAGRNNRYGHPTDDVIRTLEERAIKILRTDENGAVQFLYKGEEGVFQTFLDQNK